MIYTQQLQQSQYYSSRVSDKSQAHRSSFQISASKVTEKISSIIDKKQQNTDSLINKANKIQGKSISNEIMDQSVNTHQSFNNKGMYAQIGLIKKPMQDVVATATRQQLFKIAFIVEQQNKMLRSKLMKQRKYQKNQQQSVINSLNQSSQIESVIDESFNMNEQAYMEFQQKNIQVIKRQLLIYKNGIQSLMERKQAQKSKIQQLIRQKKYAKEKTEKLEKNWKETSNSLAHLHRQNLDLIAKKEVQYAQNNSDCNIDAIFLDYFKTVNDMQLSQFQLSRLSHKNSKNASSQKNDESNQQFKKLTKNQAYAAMNLDKFLKPVETALKDSLDISVSKRIVEPQRERATISMTKNNQANYSSSFKQQVGQKINLFKDTL